MSARAQAVMKQRTRAEPGTGFLYGWLLVALFIEYGRPASHFTLLDFPFFYSAVPMSLLLVTMFAPGLRPMQEIFSDRMAKWIFILLGLIAVSVVFSEVFKYSWDVFIEVLGRVFTFLTIARLVTSVARIRGVIITLFVAHMYLIAMNPDALFNPQSRNYIDGATFLGDGNDFALSLCILLPLMIEIGLSRRGIGRYLAFGGGLVVVFAIIATQSRGGTLGLVAVMAYLWWRSPRKIAAIVALGVLAVAALLYAPPEYFARMETLGGSQLDGSAQGRIDAWKGAIGMGLKNPIIGVGAGHFGPRWGKTAHSMYMLALAELGIPGLISVLVLVIGGLRDNIKSSSKLLAGPKPGDGGPVQDSARMIDMLSAGMIGLAVAGAFLSVVYYPHIYVLTGLMIAGRLLGAEQFRDLAASKSSDRAKSVGRRRNA